MNEVDLERKALREVREVLAPLTATYTVVKILGAGAMGYVLLVRHRVFGLRAMKLLQPSLLRHEVLKKRFDIEAKIMHELSHPNLVRVHEMGQVGDHPYIVMDFLEGGTLDQYLETFGKMPPRQAVKVAMAILRGLQVAHDAGVVHRDIKPGNILLHKDGTPKIADFGIAHIEEGTRSMTREGVALGTPAYMSPEQLNGEISLIDARTDIHAVGVTFYVMLTCGFLGKAAFFQQMEAHPERLEGLPDVLKMAILMAAAQNRESRFATAADMADELESYLKEGLPDDPEGTPALGSAPALDDGSLDVPDGDEPGPTKAQPGYEGAQGSSAGIVFQSVESYLGSIHPIDGTSAVEDQIDAVRHAAKRRVFIRLVLPALFLLLVGVGVWFATHPVPVTEQILVVEPTPTVDPLVVEPLLPEATPTPVELTTPTPRVETRPTVKATPTATSAVEIVPTPTPVVEPVAMVSKGQVRLVLKADTTAAVTLSGDGGTFTLTGGSREVPQGTYHVSVDMPGRDTPQTGTIVVGYSTTITCDSRFKMCTGLK